MTLLWLYPNRAQGHLLKRFGNSLTGMNSRTGMLKYLFGSLALISLSFGPVGGKYQLPGNGQLLDSFTLFTAYSASFNCCSESTFDNPHITSTFAVPVFSYKIVVSAAVGTILDISGPFAAAANDDVDESKDDSHGRFTDFSLVICKFPAAIDDRFAGFGVTVDEDVAIFPALDSAVDGLLTVKMKSMMTIKSGSRH